jgi:isocitrate dehydrogenase
MAPNVALRQVMFLSICIEPFLEREVASILNGTENKVW